MCESWECYAARLARELDRFPVGQRRAIATYLLSRCDYEIADPVDQFGPVEDTRVAFAPPAAGIAERLEAAH